MTEEQIKTYLLLGVKLKRKLWQGYIYQEEGTLYKFNGSTGDTYISSLASFIYPNAEKEWGEWEVVNDI